MSTRFCSLGDTEVRHVPGGDGSGRTLRYYFGGPADAEPDPPEAFLVEMKSHSVVPAHFHPVDQFQVFLGGDEATYQRSSLETVVAHYADGYMTYGPITTRRSGMSFYTLRPRRSQFTAYMPRDREKLTRRGRKNWHSDLPASTRALHSGEVEGIDLLSGAPGGATVQLIRAGPRASLVGPDPAGSNGQYYCILRGSLWYDSKRFDAQAVGWSAGVDAPLVANVDEADSCDVLVLRFPFPGTPPT